MRTTKEPTPYCETDHSVNISTSTCTPTSPTINRVEFPVRENCLHNFGRDKGDERISLLFAHIDPQNCAKTPEMLD